MKRKAAFLAAVALLVLLTACLAQGEREEDGLRVWYVTPAEGQRREVSAVLGTVRYTGEETVPALLEALLDGPGADSGLTGPLPAGTEAADWSLEDRVAQVVLSGPYGELSGFDLTLADCCIVLTLCQLPEVDGVRITAEGQPLQEGRLLRGSDIVFSGAEEEQGEAYSGSNLPEQ